MLKRWESIGLIRRETKSGADAETRSGTLLTLEFYAFSQNARNSKRSGNRNENDQTIRRNRNTDKPSPSPALNGPGGEAGTGTGDLPDADHDQQPPGIIFLQT